jgi:phosphoribosylglycinamide formyltransferase-1
LGVLVSGSGTNLQAIIDASEETSYPAEVAVVISNNPEAYALKRAGEKKIPTAVIPHRNFKSREDFEKEIASKLDQSGVDLVVLAGFMRVLSPYFMRRYPNRVMNIHPALLPSFPGTGAIEKAWSYGVKVTGVTVHFVDEGTDTGPIILQKEVPVEEKDDLKSLEEKIHRVEHQLYPEAIRLYAEGRLTVDGRRVAIKGEIS